MVSHNPSNTILQAINSNDNNKINSVIKHCPPEEIDNLSPTHLILLVELLSGEILQTLPAPILDTMILALSDKANSIDKDKMLSKIINNLTLDQINNLEKTSLKIVFTLLKRDQLQILTGNKKVSADLTFRVFNIMVQHATAVGETITILKDPTISLIYKTKLKFLMASMAKISDSNLLANNLFHNKEKGNQSSLQQLLTLINAIEKAPIGEPIDQIKASMNFKAKKRKRITGRSKSSRITKPVSGINAGYNLFSGQAIRRLNKTGLSGDTK